MPLLQIGMSEIPNEDAGLGSGIVNVSQQLAGAIGLAALGTIAANKSKSLLAAGHDMITALADGYRLALLIAAALRHPRARAGAAAAAHERVGRGAGRAHQGEHGEPRVHGAPGSLVDVLTQAGPQGLHRRSTTDFATASTVSISCKAGRNPAQCQRFWHASAPPSPLRSVPGTALRRPCASARALDVGPRHPAPLRGRPGAPSRPDGTPACARPSRATPPIGFGGASLLFVLSGALFFGSSHAGAATASGSATASATFCQDSLQLQNWIAQNLQPGLDQYKDGEANTFLLSDAAYLQELTQEAPAQIQSSFSTWANFTKEVADTVNSPEVAAQAPLATAAQANAQKWFTTESGCALTYKDPASSSSGIPVWVWIVVGVVAFLLLGALVGRGRRSFSSAGGGGSTGAGSYNWSSAPQQERCEYCANSMWGPGRITCTTCDGAVPEPGAERCPGCGGRQWQTCPYCRGTGVKS